MTTRRSIDVPGCRRSFDISSIVAGRKSIDVGSRPSIKSIESSISLVEDVVTPETIQDHLIFIRFQFSLLASIRSSELHRFLVHAEARYVRYLCLVEHYRNTEIPIPPWDVCVIFHAHLMDPHFFTDIVKCHPRLLKKGSNFKFPLSRIANMIRNRTWTDKSSRKKWQEFVHTGSSSYQIIDSMDDKPIYEDVEFECTRCCEVEIFPFETFYLMRTESRCEERRTSRSLGVCHGCGMVMMKERLQLGALAKDVEHWLTTESPYAVRGLVGSKYMNDDLLVLVKGTKFPSLSFHRTDTLTPLGDYILSSRRLCMDDLISAAKSTTRQIRRISCPSHISFPDLVPRHILPLYSASIYSSITSDLTETILEQSFAPGPWISSMLDLDFPHAIDRYAKFVALREGNRRYYVPTVDIDLCIKTARLSCRKRFLDTRQGKGMEALRETCVMWVRRYKEGYTTIDVRKGYWTTRRVVRGVLCPISGFKMLCDYRDLGKARIKLDDSTNEIRPGQNEVILLGIGDELPVEVLEVDIGDEKSDQSLDKEDLG